MVSALGFGVERERGGARILFKMNMARRNFRAGSPHLNQVRREDTIDSTALPSPPYRTARWFDSPFQNIFFYYIFARVGGWIVGGG